MNSGEHYECPCGYAGANAFVSLFKAEKFCVACGRKLEQKSVPPKTKKGRPKTVNKKIARSIRFDDDEWAMIRQAAEQNGQDISKFVRSNLRSIAAAILKNS